MEVYVEATKGRTEGRVLLKNVSWETYERLISEREERRVPRFFYDRGVLEIVSPSTEHEGVSRIVAALIGELVVELETDVFDAGSTTFKREDTERGFEPDGSFYFSENARRVRGKSNIELDAGNPPPDLVVEVDVTNPSLHKLPIYAGIGVPEVWRFAGGRTEILLLNEIGAGYEASAGSRVLPPLTADDLARMVEGGLKRRRPEWVREVRAWVREALPGPASSV